MIIDCGTPWESFSTFPHCYVQRTSPIGEQHLTNGNRAIGVYDTYQYQWLPMAANGPAGKYKNGSIE